MSLSNDGSAAFAGDGNRGEVKRGESGAIRSKPGGYKSPPTTFSTGDL